MHELAVIGHVTRDWVDGQERLGGAAAYAALAAAVLEVPTLLVTVAPSEHGLLGALDHGRIQRRVQACPNITSFELQYTGTERRLWVRSQADPFTRQTLLFDTVPVAYVGPVIGEVDPALLCELPAKHLVLGLQGWLRQLSPDGEVMPTVAIPLGAVPERADIVFSEADHADADALAQQLASEQRVVLVTRGASGVTAWHAGRVLHFAGVPAEERDPTGAGDVFGALYAVGRLRGDSIERAIRRAQEGAARSVEGPGLGNLSAAAANLVA